MDSDTNNETIESIESKRRDAHCCLCGAEGFDIALTDGRVLHTGCHENLTEIDAFLIRLTALQNESQSFIGLMSQLFGARNFQNELQALRSKDPRKRLHKPKREDYSDLIAVQRSLVDLYDYWPDYPPDWEERRDKAKEKSNFGCVACGSRSWPHVHHTFSLQRGGSNLPDNLEVLCSDCHSKEHKFDFSSGESRDIKGYGDKPLLIEEAIKKGKKISFRYRKFDEKKSTKRVIKPRGFKQVESRGKYKFSLCVQGHCDLRQANRVFALRRMSKLRILEK